jgi:hypothetical protein
MHYLKCTKLVRDFTGIIPESISPAIDDSTDLGSWYVNMFTVDRRKTLIFMNERTLMSFVAYGVKKSNCSDLRPVFLHGVEQLLQMEEVPYDRIVQIVDEYADIRYVKTDSRSALGSMNDLVEHYKYSILDQGGFSYCDLYESIYYANRTPQRKLGWRYSVDAMHEILNK